MAQLKKLTFEELKVEFEKLMRSIESFVHMGSEERVKRAGVQLEKESSKKLKIAVEDVSVTEEKVKVHEAEEDMEALVKGNDTDSSSSTDIPVSVVPVAIKPPSIANWKIIKLGNKGVYQIIREDGTYITYINFGAMLKSISRDVTELYRLVMQKYGTNGPEDEYESVFWGDLKTMFDPLLSIDHVWNLPYQQKMLRWRYYDSYAYPIQVEDIYANGHLVRNDDFTNVGMDLPHMEKSTVVDSVIAQAKIIEHGEGLQVLHYEVGQKHKPLYDYFLDDYNIVEKSIQELMASSLPVLDFLQQQFTVTDHNLCNNDWNASGIPDLDLILIAYVLIGKAGDTIRTLQNSSGLMIQITWDAKAKNGYSTKTNADVHDAVATTVSSSGGHTSNAAIYLDTLVITNNIILRRYLCDVLDTPAIPQAQRPPLDVNVVVNENRQQHDSSSHGSGQLINPAAEMDNALSYGKLVWPSQDNSNMSLPLLEEILRLLNQLAPTSILHT
ncbi:hypothetical protein Tco_0977532 [Tanacetum coccineum]|uniref:Uncharacterized protein n=1 Tax=Tanacetum coccineum TaxID=301880 RepID=A0ABQ5EKD0_9ASTR